LMQIKERRERRAKPACRRTAPRDKNAVATFAVVHEGREAKSA
jgi:hypothetical protein